MREISRTGAILATAVCTLAVGSAVPAAGQAVQPRDPGAMILTVPSRIGVATRDVTAEDVSRDKLPAEAGAYVSEVVAGGPADQAGIRRGDVIAEFDGVRVRGSAELQRLVRETPTGRAVKVAVIRGGKRLELTVRTAPTTGGRYTFRTPEGREFQFDLPSPEFRENPNQPFFWTPQVPNWRESPRPGTGFVFPGPIPLDTPRLGISVEELTPQLAEYFHTKEGVLVATVEDGSPASRAGMKAGDILVSIDGHPVANADDVRTALRAKRTGGDVTLGLVRDGRPLTLKATIAGEFRGLVTR